MRPVHSAALLMAAALITTLPAAAQQPPSSPGGPTGPGGPPPAQAPIKPYKLVAVNPPAASNDPSYDGFRKQLADVANRKDRAGLAKLIVAEGFFWDAADGDKADKKKPALANLEQALGGFSGADAPGWEELATAASDPTLEPLPDHKGVMCGPAGPVIDDQAFEALTKETGTDPSDWGFPTATNVEVRATGQATAQVIDKLGMNLVRVLPEQPQTTAPLNMEPPTFVRVVLPSGRTGYVAVENISPIGFDQLCYLKDATGWKITGYESAE